MFENGSDKYSIDDYFPTENGKSGWWYRTKVKIPNDLECEHCVLQWRYHTGMIAHIGIILKDSSESYDIPYVARESAYYRGDHIRLYHLVIG